MPTNRVVSLAVTGSPGPAVESELEDLRAAVAGGVGGGTSDYNALTNKPTIPAPQSVAAAISANATLAANAHTPVNATAGAVTVTLPSGQAQGAIVSVEKADTSGNAVTVSGSIRGTAGASIALVLPLEALSLIADSAGSWWPRAGHKTKASLDALYATAVSVTANTSAIATLAPLASPELTGTPTAPTAAAATNTTQLATTAFVATNALSALDAASQQLAADGVLSAGPWQQSPLRTMRPPTKVISRFPSGHGWSGGTDDLTTKLFTDRTVKCITNGAGGHKYLGSPTFTAVDMSSSIVRLIFKVDDATKLKEVYCEFATTGSDVFTVATVDVSHVVSGEWTVITFPRKLFAVAVGAPSWASITQINVAPADKSAGAVTFWLAAVEIVPDLAATYPSGVMIVEADDGYIGQKSYLAPVVGQRGIPLTYNVIGDRFVGGSPTSGMTPADLLAFQDKWGWAIACHAYASAAHNGTGAYTTTAAIEADWQRQKHWLRANGLHSGVDHLAADPAVGSGGVPEGAMMAAIRKQFRSCRTTAGTSDTAAPADPLRVRSRLFTGETVATLETIIAQVAGAGGAFVLTVHDVLAGATNGTSNGLPAIAAANLATVLDYAAGLGMVFRTRPDWVDGR